MDEKRKDNTWIHAESFAVVQKWARKTFLETNDNLPLLRMLVVVVNTLSLPVSLIFTF
jgi:hypothetical protein